MQKLYYNLEYKKEKSLVADAVSRLYNQFHHISSDIAEKNATGSYHVYQKTNITELEIGWHKDNKFKRMFDKPKNPHQREGT